jgi:hypothetical protein
MSDREELKRRYGAAVAAAIQTAESIPEWSDETRLAVSMTIRLLGRQFSETLDLALAQAHANVDPLAPERIAEVERDWRDFSANPGR